MKRLTPMLLLAAAFALLANPLAASDSASLDELFPSSALPLTGERAISADGTLVAEINPQGTAINLETATGEKRHQINLDNPHVYQIALSPSGKILAAAQKGGVPLWDTETGKPLARLGSTLGVVHAIAFTQDNGFLACAHDDRSIRLWNLTTHKSVLLFQGHKDAVRSVVFSADGKLLASCGDDRTIRLWELASGQEVLTVSDLKSKFFKVAFHPDGRRLIAVDLEAFSFHLLDLATGKVVARRVPQRLQLTPPEAVLNMGQQAAMQARLHWADGRVQDVTRWASYHRSDPEVAQVLPSGQVQGRKPGRSIIMVRYLGQSATGSATVRHAAKAEDLKVPTNNFVDELLLTEWKQAGLKPAELVGDARFLRRVHLHLIGTLPTAEEVRKFVENKDPDKRRKLIDRLLERPEYIEYWTDQWSNLLGASRLQKNEALKESLRKWVRQALQQNWPVDRLVRELLTAHGSAADNGAVAFYLPGHTPTDLAEMTTQLFLGINVRCTRCHRHPYEAWDKETYHGLTAFFAPVVPEGKNSHTVRLDLNNKLTHPGTGRPLLPQLPGEKAISLPAKTDPRAILASWLTRPDNPSFAREIINRYWAHLFGEGLIEPLAGPPVNRFLSQPALMKRLARDFIQHRYDLKHLLRTICNSRVYQLDHEPVTLLGEKQFYTRKMVQRMQPDLQVRLVAHTTGVKREMIVGTGGMIGTEHHSGPFSWSRENRSADGSCERHPVETIPRVPVFGGWFSGKWFEAMEKDPNSYLNRLLAKGESDEKICEELFLTFLTRPPKKDEKTKCLEHVKKQTLAKQRKLAWSEIVWALVNTREFLLIH